VILAHTDQSHLLGLELWHLVLVANVVITAAYAMIAAYIVRGLVEGSQWTNWLGIATAAIFASCAAGHGMHVLHFLLPAIDSWNYPLPAEALAEGYAMRTAMGDWHSLLPDALTALAGLTYLALRRRLGAILRGSPKLFRDERQARRSAIELNDNVVQGLAAAKMAIQAGHQAYAVQVLNTTLDQSKAMMTALLEEAPVRREDLVRENPAEILR
jgi:hypothetical protein